MKREEERKRQALICAHGLPVVTGLPQIFFFPLVGLYVFFRVSEWLSVRRKRFPALGKV